MASDDGKRPPGFGVGTQGSADGSGGASSVAAPAQRSRLILDAASQPKLARHIKLRHDATRDQWVLLAPERILTPSETAIAVLQLCDGTARVSDIAGKLAAEYDAPAADILADILPVLQDLADRGYVIA